MDKKRTQNSMIYAVTFKDNHILKGRQVVIEAMDDWEAKRKIAQDPGLKDGNWPMRFDPKKHTNPMKSNWISEEEFKQCLALIEKHMGAQ